MNNVNKTKKSACIIEMTKKEGKNKLDKCVKARNSWDINGQKHFCLACCLLAFSLKVARDAIE